MKWSAPFHSSFSGVAFLPFVHSTAYPYTNWTFPIGPCRQNSSSNITVHIGDFMVVSWTSTWPVDNKDPPNLTLWCVNDTVIGRCRTRDCREPVHSLSLAYIFQCTAKMPLQMGVSTFSSKISIPKAGPYLRSVNSTTGMERKAIEVHVSRLRARTPASVQRPGLPRPRLGQRQHRQLHQRAAFMLQP